MEETSGELPNFSIGIVLLRPDPRAAAKIKPNSNQRKTIVNSWVRCLENSEIGKK